MSLYTFPTFLPATKLKYIYDVVVSKSMNFAPTPKFFNAAAVTLLLMMGLLMGGAIRRQSITLDEVAHIGAGLSSLQKLDLRLNTEHPPLGKALAAVPLVLKGAKADYSGVTWSFSNGFFNQYLGEWVFGHWVAVTWNDPYSTVFWARIPMLLITLLLGWVVYVFAKKLGNAWGGLLCVSLYVSTPAFLTFGPLVLTDIIFTLFAVLTLCTFAEMWRVPQRNTMLKFALALGGALLSKFSAGLLFFCFGAYIISLRIWKLPEMPTDKTQLRAWRRLRWRYLIKGTVLAAFVVYAVYFVLSWNQPTNTFSIISGFPASLFLRRVLMPVWVFLQGLLLFSITASRPTYILGHNYTHGVWFYFPVMFVLKSSLAFLGILLLALVIRPVAKQRLQSPLVAPDVRLHWRALVVFLSVFTAACILSRLTISIRHFSVPMVLIILTLAPLPKLLESLQTSGWKFARGAIWLTATLTVVAIFAAASVYPYFMPFLNSLSLGRPAYELVNDSNLDWNQALPDVEQWVQQRRLQHVLLEEYGFSDPTVYVPQAQVWDCQEPSDSDANQWAVVSASMIKDGHNCSWLLQYPHEPIAKGSMYAFQLPVSIPAIGSPGGPPAPEDRRNIGGAPKEANFSVILYNCIRDPQQLQPTMDHFQKMFQEQQAKARQQK